MNRTGRMLKVFGRMKGLLLNTLVVICALTLASHTAAQIIFSDDFNRPDGPVGNGWSTWWDGTFEHPNTNLINAELRTFGAPNQSGGIFRSLPTTFPLVISFDFRTLHEVDDFDPDLPFNDGGWLIVFNAAPVASPPPYPPNTDAQVIFQQYAGSRNINRSYLTESGMVSDSAPALQEPIPGQRDYSATAVAHIEGLIHADLSATFRIHYNDGQTPDPITISFGPGADVTRTPPGSIFVFGNSNRSNGPHFFDNLTIEAGQVVVVNNLVTFEPEPSTYSFTPVVTGCPAGFVGIFSFDARLTNISDRNLANLQVAVAEFTAGNLLLTEDSLLGEGERFGVPQRDDFSDARLSPGEVVDVPFAVCLQERRQFRLFVDVLGTVLLPAPTAFFSTDFNAGVPPEFSGVTTTEGVQGYAGLGTGSNVFDGSFLRNASSGNPASKTTLTLTGLLSHTSIDVNFLLAIIDSWDGGTGNVSPDFFNVTIDGNLIFSESFTNISAEHGASYPNATTPPAVVLAQEANLGFTNQTGSDCSPWFCDSAYDMGLEPTFQNIPHTSSTLTIEWFASGDGWQGSSDESWAIDNVEVILK